MIEVNFLCTIRSLCFEGSLFFHEALRDSGIRGIYSRGRPEFLKSQSKVGLPRSETPTLKTRAPFLCFPEPGIVLANWGLSLFSDEVFAVTTHRHRFLLANRPLYSRLKELKNGQAYFLVFIFR